MGTAFVHESGCFRDPPAPFNYDCVPAGESQHIGPAATVWEVVATGDPC